MIPNKEYIQPQWILDCINSAKLLSIADYEPGRKLPAHISPFYEFSEDGHIKVNKKIIENDQTEVNTYSQINNNTDNLEEEDVELKEMLISKNKKKMLDRLREEQSKKKKVLKVKNIKV